MIDACIDILPAYFMHNHLSFSTEDQSGAVTSVITYVYDNEK